jgi:hypothetical protein
MPSYSRVPLARLDILPIRALLQIQFAFGIEQMQMDHRVQQSRTIMALAASCRAYGISVGIHYREYLLFIVL